jgi:hypothetical protein
VNPFETYLPTQARNIENCTQLTEAQKKDFFETMSHAVNDEKVVRNMAEKYFREPGRKLCGKSVMLDTEIHFGRVHEWRAIENLLRDCKKYNGDIVPAETVLGWKERFLTGAPAIKRNVLEEVLETLQDFKAPSPCIIWAFLFMEADRPFAKENLDELPCRLGLKSMMSNEYLPMELHTNMVTGAKAPTAFDAELYEYWCPGGRTCPRSECSGKNGFHEAVMGGRGAGGVSLWHIVKAPTFELMLVKK